MQAVRSCYNRVGKGIFKAFSFSLFLILSFCLSATAQGDYKQQRPRVVPSPDAKQTPSNNQPIEVDDGDVVRVDTQLVNVPTVVYDQSGRPLTNLKAENFVVYEDGKPQQLSNFSTAEAPFEVALLLDTSGSTADQVELIRRAASSFIAALRPGDRVAIIAFNKRPTGGRSLAVVDILSRLTNDRDELKFALEQIGSSNGTPYYDSLLKITDDIFRFPPKAEVRGRRALVALTDGVDSSSELEFSDVRDKLQKANVACYFIELNTANAVEDRLLLDCKDPGVFRLSIAQLQRYRRFFNPKAPPSDYESFCELGQFQRMDISDKLYMLAHKEMEDLSKNSGGKIFPVASLNDARTAFAQVAKEIGTLYSLGYYSTNQKRDGSFRIIRVELKGIKGASLKAREGYVAPKS